MSEILWNLMEILYKRGYVEYSGSLNANVLKEYNLEVPGLRPAWSREGAGKSMGLFGFCHCDEMATN